MCYRPIIHHSCVCNEFVGVVNRLISKTPKPDNETMVRHRKWCKKFWHLCLRHVTTQDRALSYQHYGGAKYLKYLRADLHLDVIGQCDRKHADGGFFVKQEYIDPLGKINPDPRIIQFPRSEYVVELNQYLKPVEALIYNMKGDGKKLTKSKFISKGLNQWQKADLIVKKFRSIPDCAVVCLDANRFEKHCSVPMLSDEFYIYSLCNNDPRFAELLSWQLETRSTSRSGLSFVMQGRRASGRPNTGSGNCLLSVVNATWILSEAQHEIKFQWDVLDDGDDLLLFVETKALSYLKFSIPFDYHALGYVMRIESISTKLEEIVYCSSRVVELPGDKFFMVRDPVRILSRSVGSIKYLTMDVPKRLQLLDAVAHCELALNPGIPIIQTWATVVIKRVSELAIKYKVPLRKSMEGLEHAYYWVTAVGLDPWASPIVPIAPVTRDSYFAAFGIDSSDQVDIETYLEHFYSFDITGDITQDAEFDPISWTMGDFRDLDNVPVGNAYEKEYSKTSPK